MLDFFSFLWSELLDRLGEALTDTLTSAYWVGSSIHAWEQRFRFSDECGIEVLKVPGISAYRIRIICTLSEDERLRILQKFVLLIILDLIYLPN